MKKISIILICTVLIATISALVFFIGKPSAIKSFNKDFSIVIPKDTKIIFEESDVAIDGSSFLAAFQIDSSETSMVKEQIENAGWSKLPIDGKFASDLTEKFYVLSQNGVKIIDFNCKNGYFIIRQNSSSKTPIDNDPTSNIKIAIFDLEKERIYYCRWTY